MEIRNKIIEIFEENGVSISAPNNSLLDMESIQFISIIVEIEQTYDITLPDYLLDRSILADFEAFFEVLKELILNKDCDLTNKSTISVNNN